MTIETVETRCCYWCNKLTGGNPESFKEWVSFTIKPHPTSSELKAYYVCPVCIGLHDAIHNKEDDEDANTE
jgi:hypothetical protein